MVALRLSMAHNHKKEWWEFHKDNPKVYKLFCKFTHEAIEAGCKNFGTNAIIERIRWETNVVTRSDDEFKINNNHAPYYARLFMHYNPEYEGFFRTRQLLGE